MSPTQNKEMSEAFLARCNLLLANREMEAYGRCIAEFEDFKKRILKEDITPAEQTIIGEGLKDQVKIIKLNPSILAPTSIFAPSNVGKDALFWLLLFKLSKKDPKSVERILISLFNSAGDALDAFCRAGSSNRISAWGSARLLSLYMERFGLITQPQAIDFVNGLNTLTGMEVAEELATLIPWKSFTPDIDFPQTVVLGSKTRQIKVTREPRPKKTTKISKTGELVIEEE